MSKSTKHCVVCGKEFQTKPSHYNRRRACSYECSRKDRTIADETRIALFWSRVKQSGPDECWEWQGPCYGKGYGHFRWGGRNQPTSRVAWTITNGDPGELWVLHTCDNPACCNPDHLFLGTHDDNMKDMLAPAIIRQRESATATQN
jgi:hypothetical protein